MRTTAFFANALMSACLMILGTEAANAQATRTWISGVGNDANPCSRTAPCKTFAGAISKTATGGEIDILDPGGFGAVTITKSITFDGGGGQVGSVLVSGTDGIVVAAGSTDVVTLRNLRLNGIGSGLNGINIISAGSVNVENCFIFGFTTNGIRASTGTASQLKVQGTTIKQNTGASTNGILVAPGSGGSAKVSLLNVILESNGANGLKADATLAMSPGVNVTLTDSQASHNGNDGVLAVSGASAAATVIINHATLAHNAVNGIEANQSAGSNATIVAGISTFDGNAVAALSTGGGTVGSYSNNFSNGNTTNNGTFSPVAPH
jgi:hypothetical protein